MDGNDVQDELMPGAVDLDAEAAAGEEQADITDITSPDSSIRGTLAGAGQRHEDQGTGP